MFTSPSTLLGRPALRFARRQIPSLARRTRSLSLAQSASRPRSWRNIVARCGLAAGAVYFYNTSNVFAEEPARKQYLGAPLFRSGPNLIRSELATPLPSQPPNDTSPRSLDEVVTESRRRRPPPSSEQHPSGQIDPALASTDDHEPPRDPSALEVEAEGEGAFNPETGEINWDCPCLGGMAHGPCGEDFKAAFSCFVYSNDEPKGMDCIEHFK